jgi:hypothetical protein
VTVHRGAHSLIGALVLLAVAGCSGVGGGGSPPSVPYDELKGNLAQAYDDLSRGIDGGAFDRVPSLCTALGVELDRVEAAAKRWGILEREKMNLAIATARRALQSVARTAPATGDAELLRAQLRPVGEAGEQAEGLLDQAAAATQSSS